MYKFLQFQLSVYICSLNIKTARLLGGEWWDLSSNLSCKFIFFRRIMFTGSRVLCIQLVRNDCSSGLAVAKVTPLRAKFTLSPRTSTGGLYVTEEFRILMPLGILLWLILYADGVRTGDLHHFCLVIVSLLLKISIRNIK